MRSSFRWRFPAPRRRNSPSQQECRGFAVLPYVATQPEFHGGDLSDAALEIPSDWLMPWLDLEAVRQAQRPDAAATLTADHLILTGVELVVERRWLREAYWRQVKQAIIRGYIYKSSAVQVTLRGERREHERRNTGSTKPA